ncbi:MAG TPA: SIR2 family protein [Polyangiaceae bacterium]|nr:SIR2 family protein [Polyangiaceae bacterium]
MGIEVTDALCQLGSRLLAKQHPVHALVGAGLSASAGLPGWEGLLNELAPLPTAVPGPHDAATRSVPRRDERADKDLPWRAQLVEQSEKGEGRKRLREHLQKRFWRSEVPPSDPLRSVVRLPFEHILTTNYDNLLDLTHAEVLPERAHKVLRWEVPLERLEFVESLGTRGDTRFYVHLHGRADRPDTCILTEEDYREHYVRSQTLSRNLYAMFASQTFVFIGFSLTDPDFVEILRETQAYGGSRARHYAILPRPDEGEAGLTAYLLGKYGVTPILYPNVDGRHEGLALVLRDLESLAANGRDWTMVALGNGPADDPNKGQFGGSAELNGYLLRIAEATNLSNDWATMKLEVVRSDGSPMKVPVAFYLHPTFRESVVRVVPDAKGQVTLSLHAWGAFTIGVVVNDQGTKLELDLTTQKQLFNSKFLAR